MSVLDNELIFSDAQTQVASSAAVTQSTNVADMTEGKTIKNEWDAAKDNEIGGLTWNLVVGTVINAVTIITAKLMSHSAATSIKSGTEIAEIVLDAAAAAGTKKAITFPVGLASPERYLGVTYTVSGAKCTTGAIDSWLGLENEVVGPIA